MVERLPVLWLYSLVSTDALIPVFVSTSVCFFCECNPVSALHTRFCNKTLEMYLSARVQYTC